MTQPGAARPGAVEPGVAEPGVAEPEVAEPEVAEPEVAEPGVAEPGVAEPGVARSEAARPETAQWEAARRWDEVVDAAVALGHALEARGWMIATAESCTGGSIARALTELGGSSAWFERGFVTYADAAKTDLLEVPSEVLASCGAVSEAVAARMAEGALKHSRAQFALSVTGIAGPGGATPDKSVGTVCFGWASIGQAPKTATMRFGGDRAAVRDGAALHALRCALEHLADERTTTHS